MLISLQLIVDTLLVVINLFATDFKLLVMDFYDDLSDFEDCPTILMLKRERSRLRTEKYAACISQRTENWFVIKKSLVTHDSRFSVLPRGQGVFTKVGGLHVIKFEGGVPTLKTKMISLGMLLNRVTMRIT